MVASIFASAWASASGSTWILAHGIWEDEGLWDDTALWDDGA